MIRGETVIRRRPSDATDEYGNRIDGATTDTTFEEVKVAPGSSAEPVSGRGEVLSQTTLYFDVQVDARPTDRWVVRGQEHSQDGEPAEWRSGTTGLVVGTVVTLKQVEG